MKASLFIKHLQSQVELFGDQELVITSATNRDVQYKQVIAVSADMFGNIEIVVTK